jgi:hypothetical protein
MRSALFLKQTIVSAFSVKLLFCSSEFILLFKHSPLRQGTALAQWLSYCVTNKKVAGSIPDGVIGIFHWHKSFRSHYGLGVDSASNRSEYQGYFVGVNAAGV